MSTRIVGGLARGRRLAVPPRGTRPTSERAREAMFNSLRAHVDLDGARVLDLFAGTGAVGLEALSRGAATATFVESGRAAAAVLASNIDALALPGARLERRPVATFLASVPATPFDLVFADPPYAYGEDDLAETLRILARPRWLRADAVVVIEREARGPEPRWPRGIDLVTQRRYGAGVLWYGRRVPDLETSGRSSPMSPE